jgi:hypothetical protein
VLTLQSNAASKLRLRLPRLHRLLCTRFVDALELGYEKDLLGMIAQHAGLV